MLPLRETMGNFYYYELAFLYYLARACSTVVEHSPQYTNFKGLKPAIGALTLSEKVAKIVQFIFLPRDMG
jgi:hypothetical protein